ncbi:hypothetical protein F3Y22_tig00110647pilonHSYRG00190 [Hibiscus syriacus]|uniref:Uncharacterized protein n=1 Tax=Hibiscus syriacus TaxID=106335 RepID=A0A6A2ZY38_HIBSY|nr:hypothetical protein F3Y22_tig00110647pilonHSYRG00190 [Hibiscus syriacus]
MRLSSDRSQRCLSVSHQTIVVTHHRASDVEGYLGLLEPSVEASWQSRPSAASDWVTWQWSVGNERRLWLLEA